MGVINRQWFSPCNIADTFLRSHLNTTDINGNQYYNVLWWPFTIYYDIPPVNTYIYIYVYTHDSICTVSIIIQVNRPLFIFPIDCSGIVYPILWNLSTLLSNAVYPHQWSPVATNHYFPLSILDCWWFNPCFGDPLASVVASIPISLFLPDEIPIFWWWTWWKSPFFSRWNPCGPKRQDWLVALLIPGGRAVAPLGPTDAPQWQLGPEAIRSQGAFGAMDSGIFWRFSWKFWWMLGNVMRYFVSFFCVFDRFFLGCWDDFTGFDGILMGFSVDVGWF